MPSQPQDPKPQAPSASREWMAGLAFLGVMFAGLLVVAWWLGLRAKVSVREVLKAPAITAVELGTARVEILKVTYGDKAEWTAPAPAITSPAKKIMSLNARRENSWSVSGMRLSTTFDNGRQTAFSASLDRLHLNSNRTSPALGVLLRLNDTSGTPLASPYFQSQEERQLIELTLTSSKQSTKRTTLPVEQLPEHGLMVEMEDGDGGWLPMNGPVFFQPEEGLAWALISAFPRTQAELKLRFEYQKVVGTCVIKNPVQVTTLPTWTAEKAPVLRWAPIVRKTDDYQFEVLAMGSPKGMAEGWLDPYVHLDNKGLRSSDFTLGWSVHDRMGNELLPMLHGEKQACRLLPGETQARLVVQVRPTFDHAWKEAEVTFVAEGEWADITSLPVLKLTEDGRKLGFKDSVIVSRPAASRYTSLHKPVVPPEVEIELEIKGEGSAADRRRLDADYENGSMALFEAAEHSIGQARKSGHGEGHRAGRQTWSHRSLWRGIPAAGMRLRLGLIKHVVPDTHEFTFQIR